MLTPRIALALALAIGGLTGCGGDGGDEPIGEPLRSYTVVLRMEDHDDEYHYVVVGEVPTFQVGDEVTFEAINAGTLEHDLQVVGPDGLAVATAEEVIPGDRLMLTVRLEAAGIYQLNCLVDNHLTEHGMQELIQVVDA